MTETETRAGRNDHWRPANTAMLLAIAIAWLLASLWASYVVVDGDPSTSTISAIQATLALPAVVVASLLAGAAVAMFVIGWLGDADAARTRVTIGLGAGIVVGIAAAAPVLVVFGTDSFMTTVAIAVAVAAMLGGALAALRPAVAVAAGLAGALACVGLGLVQGYFQGDLIQLIGGGESGTRYVATSQWLQLTYSIVSGLLAGLVPFWYLRRSGLALPWPVYLAAGAAPGVLLLAAEGLVRIGGGALLRAAGAAGEFDALVLSTAQSDRLTHAMIVFFVGAVSAIIAVGRTMKRA